MAVVASPAVHRIVGDIDGLTGDKDWDAAPGDLIVVDAGAWDVHAPGGTLRRGRCYLVASVGLQVRGLSRCCLLGPGGELLRDVWL